MTRENYEYCHHYCGCRFDGTRSVAMHYLIKTVSVCCVAVHASVVVHSGYVATFPLIFLVNGVPTIQTCSMSDIQ
jgi:hypothetical protein